MEQTGEKHDGALHGIDRLFGTVSESGSNCNEHTCNR